MPLLTLDQISHAYGHLPLLDRAALRVDPGERLALIGRNGTGKSTLLRIIAGELAPDAGSVWRMPASRIARLSQDVLEEPSRTVREEIGAGLPPVPQEDAWAVAHKVDTVMSRLSLPGDALVQELSGGWRRRVLLGRALVSDPDVLLLDEPTNHLDVDAIQWLERHLAAFAGALVFVTHDRAFLRRLATRIIELDRGRLTSWPGSYDGFLEKKAAALEAEARDLSALDRKLAEEEAWLRRGIKARRTRNEGRVRALLALRAERAARRSQVGDVRMAIDTGEASGRMVFELQGVSKRFDDTSVVHDFTARIVRGDRIGLLGPNGSGKTTLLRLLMGELAPDQGDIRRGARLQIAYFDQNRQQLDPDRTVAESVTDGDVVTINGQARHVLGYLADFLFPPERAHAPIKALSGGERNRLLLARLFAQPANVLILDEPTNDLDIETLELLEALIAEFDGTVLLVTHDREFLDNVITSTWAFEGSGRVVEYVGGWDDYVRQADDYVRQAADYVRQAADYVRQADDYVRQAPPAAADEPARRKAALPAASGRVDRRKKTFREEREHAALPATIERLEEEQRALQQEAAAPEFYKTPADRIRTVLARIEAIEDELGVALSRWVELEEIGR